MSKNNDFDSDRRRPDLNEYLSKEITQYYGEDVISDIESSSAPIPPKRRRNSRLISALGIICAVMFLTGAVIFSGVFFTSGISGFGSGDGSDSDIVSNTSHNSENDTDSNIHGNISSSYSTDNAIETDTSTENITSEFFDDTDDLYSDTDTYSSNYIAENISTDIDTDITDTDRIADYFSLPEYPNEQYISETATDVNNNSETNPNDNVTTGKKFRAGVGTLLMILSLITAFALTQTGDDNA